MAQRCDQADGEDVGVAPHDQLCRRRRHRAAQRRWSECTRTCRSTERNCPLCFNELIDRLRSVDGIVQADLVKLIGTSLHRIALVPERDRDDHLLPGGVLHCAHESAHRPPFEPRPNAEIHEPCTRVSTLDRDHSCQRIPRTQPPASATTETAGMIGRRRGLITRPHPRSPAVRCALGIVVPCRRHG